MLNTKKVGPEEFIASSIIRFGRHQDYIQEKLLIDYFAIKGNLKLAKGLKIYIQNNLEKLQSQKKITILDVGPAIGALSSLIAMQVLDEFNLLDKTKIYLIDVSEKVIDATQQGNFFYPTSILNPKIKSTVLKKLKQSTVAASSAEKIPWKNETFDIALAGFLFHHLHDDIKPLVAKETMRTLKPNGFLGVAEEWFEDYKSYAKVHKNDEIPLAYESIIAYGDIINLFPSLNIFYSYGAENESESYTFCGEKSF
jgi:2-polyprenyl-3-methyl-5-hydroxy-6-metoxy-1,4-benzoquinol methylase